jgi:hypothetical protein
MAYVTTDQIERARQINVLDYILTHEANNIKRVGNAYRLKDHKSLAISDKGFYWHSHGIGGKTALRRQATTQYPRMEKGISTAYHRDNTIV